MKSSIFKQRLTFRQSLLVVLTVLLLAAAGYGTVALVSKLWLGIRAKRAGPKIIAAARLERDILVKAIDNYRQQFGVYPPDHLVSPQPLRAEAVTNQLLYELKGTLYNPSNDTYQAPGVEPIPAKLLKQLFNREHFLNAAKPPAKPKDFLGPDSNFSTREIHDDPDVNVLAFYPADPQIDPELISEFDFGGWQYLSSKPIHNTNRFDLWTEIKLPGGRAVVVGNWKGAE